MDVEAGESTLLSKSLQAPASEFIRREGNILVVGEDAEVIWLRGINFTGFIYYMWESRWPEIINYEDHAEIDFERVSAMGMNVVRLCLYARMFEDDDAPYTYKQEGWDYLDENIAWAKKYGVYLILDMHIPPGEFPDGEIPAGEEVLDWDDPEKSSRLIALWAAIADRYKDETFVAGYDLLNEPHIEPTIYQSLLQGVIDGIRTVDPNHLIIVEPSYLGSGHSLVSDENVMYDFHFYTPLEYTYQNAPWGYFPEVGSYPDDNVLQFPADLTWHDSSFGNPSAPAGNSDWAFYEGELYQVSDPEIIAGEPILLSENNQGTIYFDDLVVKEYDENGVFVRDIWSMNITSYTHVSETGWGTWAEWCYWPDDGSVAFELSTTEGRNDNASLLIAGMADYANWYNHSLRFQARQGYYYQLSGWMKGAGISEGANCQLRTNFESSPSGGEVVGLNKEYLEYELLSELAFGTENNVPMFVGEFGIYKDNFSNNRGGLDWVNDMLELLVQHDVHFTFFAYHDGPLGIYTNPEGLPDPAYANQELIDLFTEFLNECVLVGDFDNDGDVDVADIMLVASRWHTAVGDPDYDPTYDLNNDDRIDIVDIMLVAVHWGERCPGAGE